MIQEGIINYLSINYFLHFINPMTLSKMLRKIKITKQTHRFALSQIDAFLGREVFVISANLESNSGLNSELSLSITYTNTDNAIL